ncbi:hypothetical protein DSL72_000808 [Monilinia vaccinii-corymbosi]|uniref:D-lactate dehydrogenase (cytochrome) n=1 Tax=Monilinia vaccinii-corymbosi TaxID=61207 RepID=A0A8A3P023_9HELO|nr:hypothetical protein DSL72_000808 [Monilinia vaccinii-corymbosi]
MPRIPLHRFIAIAVVAFLLVLSYYHKDFSQTFVPAFRETTKDGHHVSPGEQAAPHHEIQTQPAEISRVELNITDVDDAAFLHDVLKKNNVELDINYVMRTMRYLPDAKERPTMTNTSQELFPHGWTKVTLDGVNRLPPDTLEPLEIHVMKSPRPDEIDASELLFGVSTTYKRFSDQVNGPVKEWVRWLTDGNGTSNGAGLVLQLHDTTDEQWAAARKLLTEVGIAATVMHSDPSLDMPGRYVDLVPILYSHPSRPKRKYLALIDDDTFFPSLGALMKELHNYDPEKENYIGTLTERVDFIMHDRVPMAYGGAGVFITPPLAKTLIGLPCLDVDPATGEYTESGFQGDRLLYHCIKNHTSITLNYLPRLNQLDQWGDASGFYEAGHQPLSLHHYKSWHHANPDISHLVSDACGEACIFQRFGFDGPGASKWVLANGYSLAEYPTGIHWDMTKMEGTFDLGDAGSWASGKEDVRLALAYGALREGLSYTGKKRAWEALGGRRRAHGVVDMIYVKRRGDHRWVGEGEDEEDRENVVVLSSEWSSANVDHLPVAVAYPKSTQEVSKIATICHKYRVPIVPFSGGSSLEGNVSCPYGGVSVDFAFMDQIIAFHEEDMDVQPSVSWMDLNDELAKRQSGIFFPVDPGPSAKIGGMVGTNCSGTNCVRYGWMKDWVINLTVVLSDGTIIKTKRRPRKFSAGYNLNSLFVGSEGTLGLVTEITLKLAVVTSEYSVAVVTFPTLRDAAAAAAGVMRAGIQVAAMEIMDKVQMKVVNLSKSTAPRQWKELPTLFFKFSGTKASVKETIAMVSAIARAHHGSSFEFAKDAREQKLLSEVWSTDVAVPFSRLADIIELSKKEMDELGLFAGILGHVGDGNFHESIMYDKRVPGEMEKVERCVKNMVIRALEMEGTVTD